MATSVSSNERDPWSIISQISIATHMRYSRSSCNNNYIARFYEGHTERYIWYLFYEKEWRPPRVTLGANRNTAQKAKWITGNRD